MFSLFIAPASSRADRRVFLSGRARPSVLFRRLACRFAQLYGRNAINELINRSRYFPASNSVHEYPRFFPSLDVDWLASTGALRLIIVKGSPRRVDETLLNLLPARETGKISGDRLCAADAKVTTRFLAINAANATAKGQTEEPVNLFCPPGAPLF